MKKLIIAVLSVTCAVSVFAQGTIVFNNRVVGSVVTHVYAPLAANPGLSVIGNGAGDTASGSTDWTGWNVIGANGIGGTYGGSNTLAALLAAPGSNQPESSLQAASPTTTFRTGAAGGFVFPTTASLGNVLPDATVATLEMVAWDNSSGNYSTWTQASAAWKAGLIVAGESGRFNVAAIGGQANPAPNLVGLQSFNLYSNVVPEPSTLALAGLGAAALLIFRRRK
jgi:hypothetical protein